MWDNRKMEPFLKLETSFGQDLSFSMEEACFEPWLLREENKTDWKMKENLGNNCTELTTMKNTDLEHILHMT